MKELAVYLMLILGGNATPSQADVEKAMSSVGLEVDATALSKLLTDIEGKDVNELMTSGKGMLAKFGAGGGGGGGGAAAGGAAAAAEEVKEEEPEEEEAEIGGGMDMFGGGDGGGGDY